MLLVENMDGRFFRKFISFLLFSVVITSQNCSNSLGTQSLTHIYVPRRMPLHHTTITWAIPDLSSIRSQGTDLNWKCWNSSHEQELQLKMEYIEMSHFPGNKTANVDQNGNTTTVIEGERCRELKVGPELADRIPQIHKSKLASSSSSKFIPNRIQTLKGSIHE